MIHVASISIAHTSCKDVRIILVSLLFARTCLPALPLESVVGFSNMRKGDPTPAVTRVEQIRQRVEKRHEAIVAKCHPAIFELAQVWKESILAINRLGPNTPKKVVTEIETRYDNRLNEIQRIYSGNVPPAPNAFATQVIFSNVALQSKSDDQGVTEWIHFERHRTPLKVDIAKRESMDHEASRRILRTVADLEARRCGKGIKDFKGELEHRNMLEALWGFGLERLTPEELVIFFDEYCPCGKLHDPDALKKLRNRFRQLLKRAI